MNRSIHDPYTKIFETADEASEAAQRLGFPQHIIRCDNIGYSVRLFRNNNFWGVIGLGEMPEKRILCQVLVAA